MLKAQLYQGKWKAVGAESGTRFDEIDLSEGEWYDYDEKVQPFDPVQQFRHEPHAIFRLPSQ